MARVRYFDLSYVFPGHNDSVKRGLTVLNCGLKHLEISLCACTHSLPALLKLSSRGFWNQWREKEAPFSIVDQFKSTAKLCIPSTLNTWKKQLSPVIWADKTRPGFWQISLYIKKTLKSWTILQFIFQFLFLKSI